MAKLYELLAVQTGTQTAFNEIVKEAIGTFKGAAHFQGFSKSLRHFDAAEVTRDVEQHKIVDTTVMAKLDYVGDVLTRAFDLDYQIDRTVCEGKADLIIDGITFVKDAPVQWFLGMEATLQKLRAMYDEIPTMQPGVRWAADPAQGPGIFRAERDKEAFTTRKTLVWKTIAPATDKHAAQVEKWFEDQPIARVTETNWSGAITPADKSDILGRLDKLLLAMKAARQRANAVEGSKDKIGAALVAYVHKGDTPTF